MSPSLFHRLLDQTDPTASLRHAAYLLVVVSSCGWLTFALYRAAMDSQWVASFGLLLAAVTTGKVWGSTDGAAASPAITRPTATNSGCVGTPESLNDGIDSAKIGGTC